MPHYVWEDPHPGVVFTKEDEKEFFGDDSPDRRSAEERRKEYESWNLKVAMSKL